MYSYLMCVRNVMILHISIPAKNPQNVADVLAELCQGVVKPFPPLENSYMVYANDEHASGFEVYPQTIECQPGESEVEESRFVENKKTSPYSAVHCAMTTQLSKTEIEAIAKREGWRYLYVRRQDLFALYELWLENQFLLEVIVAEDLDEAKQHLRSS